MVRIDAINGVRLANAIRLFDGYCKTIEQLEVHYTNGSSTMEAPTAVAKLILTVHNIRRR